MSGLIEKSVPVFRAVGDVGVLVEFGDKIDDAIHQEVLALDAQLQAAKLDSIIEMVPTYTTLLVYYDPLKTDFQQVCDLLKLHLGKGVTAKTIPNTWEIPTCYYGEFAPDMIELAAKLNLTSDEIIALHTRAIFKVYMYGFAPGYAYLGGTPEPLQLPRKQTPVANVPTGSVIIAGPQALITTVTMPSGWWNIGRTLKTPLQSKQEKPFLFDVGDHVRFVPISETEFRQKLAGEKNAS